MARRFDAREAGFADVFAAFLAEPRGAVDNHVDTVRSILDDVRQNGGEAVARYTAQFDRLVLDPTLLQSDNVDIHALAASCPPDLRSAVDFAAKRIAAYHEKQRPQDQRFTDELGIELGWRWTALASVGVYVPGGLASYPSSVLMNVIPAKLAGVERVVMVAPAPGGQLSPAVAYAATSAGVDEYYPVGGAQAVGALAYGAGRLQPVDKIVGPGNAYVAEAKRQVFGTVGIDTIAGPSEILVIADETANSDWVAADLLSQCEHDKASQGILITTCGKLADAVEGAVETQLKTLDSAGIAAVSWRDNGGIIVVSNPAEAIALANQIAPEHLELAVDDPEALLPEVKHAGAVFLGHHTPEALGDYVTGSNHVLPTSRAARFSSGLGLTDFLKRMSVQKASPEGFAALSDAALRLAEAEGLPAHARSVAIRTNR